MAAIIQNGRRWAQNGHFGDSVDSKFGQVKSIWIKHHTNMSHYPINKTL